MTSQIPGPCCDSDIEKSAGKVTFANKFTSSFKILIVKRNKIQLVFDKIYPKIINVYQDKVKHEKTCTDE